MADERGWWSFKKAIRELSNVGLLSLALVSTIDYGWDTYQRDVQLLQTPRTEFVIPQSHEQENARTWDGAAKAATAVAGYGTLYYMTTRKPQEKANARSPLELDRQQPAQPDAIQIPVTLGGRAAVDAARVRDFARGLDAGSPIVKQLAEIRMAAKGEPIQIARISTRSDGSVIVCTVLPGQSLAPSGLEALRQAIKDVIDEKFEHVERLERTSQSASRGVTELTVLALGNEFRDQVGAILGIGQG